MKLSVCTCDTAQYSEGSYCSGGQTTICSVRGNTAALAMKY